MDMVLLPKFRSIELNWNGTERKLKNADEWYERRYPTPETFLCSILYILYYISYLDSRTPQICCIPNSIGLPDHSVLFDIAYIVAVPGPTSIVYIIVLYNTHHSYVQLCPTSHKLLYVSK